MKAKVSVITVVYNDVEHIRDTMESFFSQTWENKEYIVIDGGSIDGTVDVIREYSDRLAFWCSEKDDGIYDAMNKGISHVTGDWINILNSGDVFCDKNTLKKVMSCECVSDADVIFGDSIQSSDNLDIPIEALSDIYMMEYVPIYRHGSSLIKSDVQRKFLYDVARKKDFGHALDWHMIYRAYKAGCKFMKVNVLIQRYKKEGVSNTPLKNILYNYKIVSDKGFSLKKYVFFLKEYVSFYIRNTLFYKWMYYFLFEIIVNDVLPMIPCWAFRRFVLKKMHMKIGDGTFIMKKNYFMSPHHLKIGDNSHINRGCVIDARGNIEIGCNVSISHNVSLMTGGHKLNSSNFKAEHLPIVIKDYAWIGVGSIVLKNVTIGKGAVVCAGSVVTKSVDDYAIVAGVPARKIGERTHDLNYKCDGYILFT